jgi:putative oxidoreductase
MRSVILLRFLKPLGPVGWPLVRIVAGALLALHGWSKLNHGMVTFGNHLETMGVPLPQLAAWVSMGVELGGGVLLAVGLLTRPAALFVTLNMLCALYFAHRGDVRLLVTPDADTIGYPLLLGVVSAAALLRGAGPFSLDGPDDSGS